MGSPATGTSTSLAPGDNPSSKLAVRSSVSPLEPAASDPLFTSQNPRRSPSLPLDSRERATSVPRVSTAADRRPHSRRPSSSSSSTPSSSSPSRANPAKMAAISRRHRLLEKAALRPDDSDSEDEGGVDKKPLPLRPLGWTVKVIFHSAENLPVADMGISGGGLCDPFVLAKMEADEKMGRHSEDEKLYFRTKTIHRSQNPVWTPDEQTEESGNGSENGNGDDNQTAASPNIAGKEESWVVANVPDSGFELKLKLRDEDFPDSDDRLGHVNIKSGPISEKWPGIQKERFKVNLATCDIVVHLVHIINNPKSKNRDCFITISVLLLGRTKPQEPVLPANGGGRLFTVGPSWMTRHYSPLLGRMMDIRDSEKGQDAVEPGETKTRPDFLAHQFQLPGPVPPELCHRFVPLKNIIKKVFNGQGLAGFVFASMVHDQHRQIYSYNKKTALVRFGTGDHLRDGHDRTRMFLDSVHYGGSGRVYTYVILLDGIMRFTETGPEFAITWLSKHALHSNTARYIAYSGEFFVRKKMDVSHDDTANSPKSADTVAARESHDQGRADAQARRQKHPEDLLAKLPHINTARYELVIDNESGTYRPDGSLLPILKTYLEQAFPGLAVTTKDGQKDAKEMIAMKEEHRASKFEEGAHFVFKLPKNGGTEVEGSDDESEFRAIEKRRKRAARKGLLGKSRESPTPDSAANGKEKGRKWGCC